MSEATKADRPLPVLSSEGLGAAAPKRDRLVLWANLLMVHLWVAAWWVPPGWYPAAMALVSILIAGLMTSMPNVEASGRPR